MSDSSFAKLLNDRREELGLATQGALGDLMEKAGKPVSLTTLSSWHRGASGPKKSHFNALMDVLKIPLAERDRWRAAAYAAGPETEDAQPNEAA